MVCTRWWGFLSCIIPHFPENMNLILVVVCDSVECAQFTLSTMIPDGEVVHDAQLQNQGTHEYGANPEKENGRICLAPCAVIEGRGVPETTG